MSRIGGIEVFYQMAVNQITILVDSANIIIFTSYSLP